MGSLGSFALGLVTFVLTVPVRVEHAQYDCAQGRVCPSVTDCFTLLGWQDVLAPLGCSRWAALGVGAAVGLMAAALGRTRAARRAAAGT